MEGFNIGYVIAVISLIFGIYQWSKNDTRNQRLDSKADASQLTTVIVKLENIGTGISEIKSEMTNIKNDMKEDHDKLIQVEASIKSAHKRIDAFTKNLKIEINEESEGY